MHYTVRTADIRPALSGDWTGPAWAQADTLEIAHFCPESSDHRPRTRARVLYDTKGLFGAFFVEDRYVRCTRTDYMSDVWRDSCVEFFVQPKPGQGYFNFEFNCGGALLCSYVVDPTRTPDGFADFTRLPEGDGRQVVVYHSLPSVVEPEIAASVTWTLAFFIPFSLLAKYVSPIGPVAGQAWRANFYKCAEDNSHPHWAAWAPVDELNFHLPRCFGTIAFAGVAPGIEKGTVRSA